VLALRGGEVVINKFLKIGLVIGGYVVAFVIAFALAWLRQLTMQEVDPVQFAGGMYGFGDLLFFLGLFGALSFIPTAMALFFLRPFPKFWTFLSIAALIVAATAPLAVILFFLFHGPNAPGWADLISFVSVVKIMATPFFAIVFLVTAIISPPQPLRWALVAAAAIEAAVCACALTYLATVVYYL
jgi:hypothetical protein